MTVPDWARALRRYLVASVALHFVWEVVQLPLYTISSKGTLQQQAFAVFHCTIGDAMIAGLALFVTLAAVGRPGWPYEALRPAFLLTLLIGFVYTIYSEWLNVSAIAGHESEPRLGTNEEWPAETKHDRMKEELVLIDQPKLGQACR